jgi:hypothetical protein
MNSSCLLGSCAPALIRLKQYISRRFILALVCSLMVIAPALLAQTASTGALSGTVTDPSGAVVTNVTVTLTSADTGAVRTTTTGSDGSYKFGLLAPGNYNVRFSAAGFKPEEVPGIVIAVTESPVLNRALEVGAQTEQVVVEANVEAIQTSTSSLGTVVGNKTATDLPLTTRNYTNLIGLSAGANASVNNASGFGKGGVDTSVNGMMSQDNNYMMDGVALTTQEGGSVIQGFYSGLAIPNPDTLQEFKIQTSLYDAGYGRNPGANVNVVTKSGTNAYHGSAYEFFRNTDLNATDFFRNRTCAVTPSICAGQGVKQVLNQNQFGGTVGGPIKKDKLFIFGAYQQTWQKNGAAGQGFSSGVTLPPIPGGSRGMTSLDGSDNAGAASFQAALGAAFCPQNHPGNAQFLANPGGAGAGMGTQVACNGSNINPYAMRFLQATQANGSYVIPGSGSSGYVSGIAFTQPAYDKEYQGMLNLDYQINSKNTLSSKYFRSYEPQSIAFFGTAIPLPGDPGTTDYGYQNGILKLTSLVSNSMVNELRGSILRGTNYQTQDPSTGMYASNIYPACSSLAAGSNIACVPNPTSGLLGGNSPQPPQVTIQGQFQAFGGTNNVLHNQTSLGVGDQFSWSKGKHTMRFGGEWEATRWTWVGSWLSHGIMAFQTFQDFLIGLPGGCGAAALPSAAEPLGCNGTGSSNVLNTSNFDVRSSPSGIVHGYRMRNGDAFFQDDYKVTQRLTVNMGLRWEYDGNLSDKYGNAVNLWPSAISSVPSPVTTQLPTPGVPLFPAGGSYAGWVVPSNYKGPLFPGIIDSGHIIASQSSVPKDDFAPRLGFAYQPEFTNKLVLRGGFGFFYDRIDGNLLVHAVEQSPPYAPTLDQPASTNQFSSLAAPFEQYQLGQFPERWVNFTPGLRPFDQSSNITEAAEAQIVKTPLVYSYNFNLQYQFAPRWVLELGYVGSHGIHQAQNLHLINEPGLASPSDPINGITENLTSNASLRVPYLGFGAGGLQYFETNGDIKFNSLQVTLRKQFSHGLTMQAAYTWSRAFADFLGPGGSNSGDPNNFGQQYGLNTQYRPQRLVINYNYEIPTGTLAGAAHALLGGWSLSGVTTIQDGYPLIIADSRGGAIYGLAGTAATELSRAQIAAGMTYADIPSSGPIGSRLGGPSLGCGYFACAEPATATHGPADFTAFSTIPIIGATPGVAGTGGTGWGDSGIGAVLGPGQFNFDVTLAKTTRVGGIRENAVLQFRAEFFNLFNHPQFGSTGTVGVGYAPVADNLGAGNFGQITSLSVNPRLMQLALKYVF